MKTRVVNCSPCGAWLASLPIALGIPLAVYTILWAISQPAALSRLNLSDLKAAALIYGFSMAVHFTAYLVTGLPIFCKIYRHPTSPVWTSVVAIPLGAVLGAFTLGTAYLVLDRAENRLPPLSLLLIGACYGIATAVAALLQRPHARPVSPNHHPS